MAYYTITDLDEITDAYAGLGGLPVFAFPHINQSGQVAGTGGSVLHQQAQPGDPPGPLVGGYHAFLGGIGPSSDLGTLDGRESVAGGVNTAGQVVGTINPFWHIYKSIYFPDPEETPARPFLYAGVQQTYLDIPSATSALAWAINDNQRVVGTGIFWPEPVQRAFVYDLNSHQVTLIPLPPGSTFSDGRDINASDHVVGGVYYPVDGSATDFTCRPFLYKSGSLTVLPLPPDGGWGAATAVNDSDMVVGGIVMEPDGLIHAFQYDGSATRDLGTLPGEAWSVAHDINTHGQIVGWSSTQSVPSSAAVIWYNSGSRIIDLNTQIPPDSGWYLAMATGINRNGLIVGLGTYGGKLGPYRHFLLTPPPQGPQGPYIPREPGALLAARVLFGVVQDGGGVVIVGKHGIHIGPDPGPEGVSPVPAPRAAGDLQGVAGDVAAPRRRRWFRFRRSGR